MQNILLVEDDKNLNRGIAFALGKEGYQVDTAFSFQEGKKLFWQKGYDMVICDITLPDGSGLDLGRDIRRNSGTYLIYLTAMDTEIDMLNGYESGADDYITKPFSLMVLISKVHARMRRIGSGEKEKGILYSGDLIVSVREMKVQKGEEELLLSKKELQLLIYLLENAGHIVSREQILSHVWDMDGRFVDENTVAVNISRLKRKLGTDEISNVRGLGYLWTGEVRKG